MYTRSTDYYDLIYRDLKDYGEEAGKIDSLLRRISPRPQHLLDIGCGTGEHAFRLNRDFGYQVDGLDIQPGFVKIAQKKSPQARFEVADMRRFNLPGQYDCLLCLFSSIGYVETLTGLRDALSCFARHLKPKGWLILEPWITPDVWRPGQVDVIETTDTNSGETIQRTRTGDTDGTVSIINIDYEVRSGDQTHRLNESHRLGLFTKEEMNQELERAGFQANWMPVGLQLQPIVVGQLRKQ
ncbi:class I SAM-dependent DNA methyltransferase [Pelagicoccus mobilis]|uniref:Class I SAM-dependent methyltransferase n=1 Tax=Pelagicoccus mobilis TaxID=415221 RepID=A0A934S257_9BACT|nr:class I SAM-dependent methyltransferase [Pelagicoccus mobilis]MBK1878472.1 class I SAM-dependent methyltransferase [Pelagicoccus mobilis]